MTELNLYSNFAIAKNAAQPKRRLSLLFYPVGSVNSATPNTINSNNMYQESDSEQRLQLQKRNSKSSIMLDEQCGNNQPSHSQNHDLCNSLRIFLRFGRILGILPINGLFSKNASTENMRFSPYSCASISSCVIIVMLSINVVVGLLNIFLSQKQTASELAFSCAMAFFYFMGLFTYLYFLRNCQEFIELFKLWKTMKKLYFSTHQLFSEDIHLFRDTNFVAGLIFLSAIMENMLLFCLQSKIISFPNQEQVNASIMDVYYHESHTEWLKIYNQTNTEPVTYLGYFVFFSNKFALYSWNYADTSIIILSRALYYKFKILNKVAEKLLVDDLTSTFNLNTMQQWKQLTIDHSTICQLLSDFEHFLSPIVFTCFATNIFFICLQIKMGLSTSSNTNFISSTYFIWSLLHLLMRVYMVSLSAAKINDYVHETRILYQACPTHAYTLEVQRADLLLGTTQVGLTGLRCFVITKPFLLTIVGVVFTLEIVLLQTIQ